MSYCPGSTLEDYLGWAFSLIVVDRDNIVQSDGWRATYAGQRVVSRSQFVQIVTMYEPQREYVEEKLRDFDEDEQGWRQYAAYSFDNLDEAIDEAIIALIKSWNITPTESAWVSK